MHTEDHPNTRARPVLCRRYSEKQVGYTACSILLNEVRPLPAPLATAHHTAHAAALAPLGSAQRRRASHGTGRAGRMLLCALQRRPVWPRGAAPTSHTPRRAVLPACCLLPQRDEFLRLSINAIHNDLCSRNEAFQCLALTFVGNSAWRAPGMGQRCARGGVCVAGWGAGGLPMCARAQASPRPPAARDPWHVQSRARR